MIGLLRRRRDARTWQLISDGIDKLGETRLLHEGAGKKVLIVGDSYTSGDHLEDKNDRWAAHLGRATGWEVWTNSISRTGYVNEGFGGAQRFVTRASRVLAAKPAMVMVQGGLNDALIRHAKVTPEAWALLDRFASVQDVVLVGPPLAPGAKSSRVWTVDRELREAAVRGRRTYVSAVGWSDLEYMPDGIHLTPAGHLRFAERVLDALKS